MYPYSNRPQVGESYDKFKLVVDEIYNLPAQHRVRVGRKTLQKYGRNQSVATSVEDITPEEMPGTETILTTNAIDTLTSDNAADVDVPVYIEGMTYAGGVLTFVTQVVNTDGSDGTTKVVLPTPLAVCTRARAIGVGDIYISEDDTHTTPGIPDTASLIHNVVLAGEGVSFKASTAVAGSNYFAITHLWANIGKASSTAAANIRLRVLNIGDSVLGNNFYTLKAKSCSLSGPYDEYLETPLIITPNSYVKMTAEASTGTLDVFAGFDGFFLDILNP